MATSQLFNISQGNTITANVSAIRDENGLPDQSEFKYSWSRSQVNGGEPYTEIPGAVNLSYVTTQEDVKCRLIFTLTYVDLDGNTNTIPSTATAPINNVESEPNGNVILTGSVVLGEYLTIVEDLENEDGIRDGSKMYNWYRDGEIITGGEDEDSKTYRIRRNDIGSKISARVWFTDDNMLRKYVMSTETSTVPVSITSTATS
jgi:hypothetical protein